MNVFLNFLSHNWLIKTAISFLIGTACMLLMINTKFTDFFMYSMFISYSYIVLLFITNFMFAFFINPLRGLFTEFKTIKFKANRNQSNIFNRNKPLIYLDNLKISKQIRFTHNSIFTTISSNRFDCSRLFGISFGSQTNSFSFGFSFLNNIPQIYKYVYIKGKKYIELISILELYKTFEFEIIYDKDKKIVIFKIYSIDNLGDYKLIYNGEEKVGVIKWFGYYLAPYIIDGVNKNVNFLIK